MRYLHELLGVLMQLLQYRQRLFRKAVFEDALNDSAAVRVSGEGKNLRDMSLVRVSLVFCCRHFFAKIKTNQTKTLYFHLFYFFYLIPFTKK